MEGARRRGTSASRRTASGRGRGSRSARRPRAGSASAASPSRTPGRRASPAERRRPIGRRQTPVRLAEKRGRFESFLSYYYKLVLYNYVCHCVNYYLLFSDVVLCTNKEVHILYIQQSLYGTPIQIIIQ